jgi:hypothetical protein
VVARATDPVLSRAGPGANAADTAHIAPRRTDRSILGVVRELSSSRNEYDFSPGGHVTIAAIGVQ